MPDQQRSYAGETPTTPEALVRALENASERARSNDAALIETVSRAFGIAALADSPAWTVSTPPPAETWGAASPRYYIDDYDPPKEVRMTTRQLIIDIIERWWYKQDRTGRISRIQSWAIEKGFVETVWLNAGFLALKKHTATCSNCDAIGMPDEHRYAACTIDGRSDPPIIVDTISRIDGRSGRATEYAKYCGACVDNHSFCCSMTGVRYGSEQFTPVRVVDHGTACLEANKKNLALHPDGMYVNVNSNADYHHGYRAWDCVSGYPRSRCRLESISKAFNMFGIELEIMANSTSDAVKVRRAAVECGLAAERDGSLDGDYGIEIIGPPQEYDVATSTDSPWFKFLDAIQGKARGWDAGTGYGMHINMNAKAFSTTELSKFMTFICHNDTLATVIAGRPLNRYCRSVSADELGGLKASIRQHDIEHIKDAINYYGVGCIPHAATDKYQAAAIRGHDRAEVRMFRSTIRWDRFKRNIQFADSVRQYVLQESNATYLDVNNYLAWIANSQHHYPELASYLYSSVYSTAMPLPPVKKTVELLPQAHALSDTYRLPARPARS